MVCFKYFRWTYCNIERSCCFYITVNAILVPTQSKIGYFCSPIFIKLNRRKFNSTFWRIKNKREKNKREYCQIEDLCESLVDPGNVNSAFLWLHPVQLKFYENVGIELLGHTIVSPVFPLSSILKRYNNWERLNRHYRM